MNTQTNAWGVRHLSFWLTLSLALGIIFIGIRFIVAPHTGADGFGIRFSSPGDAVYGQVKGIRDICSGVVLLPLLWLRMRRATALVFITTIIVPVTDCTLVLLHNGLADTMHLLIHGGTAVVMIFTGFLLFRHA